MKDERTLEENKLDRQYIETQLWACEELIKSNKEIIRKKDEQIRELEREHSRLLTILEGAT